MELVETFQYRLTNFRVQECIKLEKKFVTFLKINGRVKPVYDFTTKSIISTIFIAENVFYMKKIDLKQGKLVSMTYISLIIDIKSTWCRKSKVLR